MFLDESISSDGQLVYLVGLCTYKHLELTFLYIFAIDKDPLRLVSNLKAPQDIKIKPEFS